MTFGRSATLTPGTGGGVCCGAGRRCRDGTPRPTRRRCRRTGAAAADRLSVTDGLRQSQVHEHPADGAVHVAHVVLVDELERRQPAIGEEGAPRRVLVGEQRGEVRDRRARVDGRRLRRARLAPGLRLQRAPERDRLAQDVAAADPDPVRRCEHRERIVTSGELGDVGELVPHDLRPEDAVRGAPVAQRAREVRLPVQAVQRGVRRRRRGRGVREQPGDVRVADVGEVVERRGRDAGGGSRLEELLGMPGDAGGLQRLAQQRAAAALRRADQVRHLTGTSPGACRPATRCRPTT